MPPIVFIAKASSALFGRAYRFSVPAAAKPGDLLIAIVATDATVSAFDEIDNPGWVGSGGATTAAKFTGSGGCAVWVLTRKLLATDGATVDVWGDGAPVVALGTLLVYRAAASDPTTIGTDTEGFAYGLVEAVTKSAIASTVNASTNFSCPPLSTTSYSDMYLGIVYVSSAAVAVTHPAGTTEREEQIGASSTLEVFEYLPEAVGAIAAKVATTAVARSGLAGSVIFAATPAQASKVINFANAGAIGLPTEGI